MSSKIKYYSIQRVCVISKLNLAIKFEGEIGGATLSADLNASVYFFLAVFAKFVNHTILMNLQDIYSKLKQKLL